MALSYRTDLAWGAKPIDEATPGLGISVYLEVMQRHHISPLVMSAKPTPGECHLMYKSLASLMVRNNDEKRYGPPKTLSALIFIDFLLPLL